MILLRGRHHANLCYECLTNGSSSESFEEILKMCQEHARAEQIDKALLHFRKLPLEFKEAENSYEQAWYNL